MNRLSCADAQSRIADLLIGHLDGDDVCNLDSHLQNCLTCREQTEALLMQDRLLAEMAGQTLAAEMTSRFREAAESLPPARKTEPQGRFRIPAWRWVAVAAAVLLLVGVVLFRREREEAVPILAVAQLEQVTGEVYVVGKESRTMARTGQKLFPGQRVQVGEEGTAVVALPDSGRLDLGPATSLSWPGLASKGDTEQSGNRIRLDEGSLIAHLASDSEKDPMVLITPHAEVVAGKTRFSLWNETDTTRIELEEGTAQITRRSDGKSVAMNSGAGAEIGRDVPLAPHPLSPRLRETRQSFGPHPGGAISMVLSNDGQAMIVGSKSGQVRIWDIASGKERLSFPTGSTALRGLALAPSGKTLVTGHDKSIRFWDVAKGQEQFSGNKPVSNSYALGFTLDGKTVLTAGYDRILRRWDPTTGHLVGTLRCKDYQSDFDYPACMTFHRDGERLAWGLKDNTARIWDTVTAKQLHVLRGHEGAVTATAFSPDGKMLATGSRDRTVKLWDLSTGNLQATLRGHRHTVLALAFSPNGQSLASGGSDTIVNLWGVTSGKQRGTFKGHTKAIHAVAFLLDGRSLVTASEDESVRLWELP